MTRVEALIVWASIAAPAVTLLLVFSGAVAAAIVFVLAVALFAWQVTA